MIRNPVKQYYILAPYHDTTRPLFVPQEAPALDDDFLRPNHILIVLLTSSQKRTNSLKLQLMTPLDLSTLHLYKNITSLHI